jgi:hypothetical protein
MVKIIRFCVFLLSAFFVTYFASSAASNVAFADTTVTGAVYNGSVAVDQAWMKLHSTGSQKQEYNVWVKGGMFSVFLLDGTYAADDYWDESLQEYVRLGSTFTVTGTVYSPDPLKITAPSKNVTGTLKLVDGSDVAKAWLSLKNTGAEQQGYTTRVNNGQFSLYLEDGTYEAVGYWDETANKRIQVSFAFSVTGGVSSPAQVAIIVPDDNVSGTLQVGNTAVAKASLNLHSADGQQWYHSKVENGQFSLYLPNGSYQVDGYWDETAMEYTQVTYTFTVTNSVSAPASLSIIVPNKNVSGTLKLQNGTNVGQAWLNIRSTDAGKEGYNTRVKDGQFSLNLPDGAYEADGYWDESAKEYVHLTYSFTVSGSASNPNPLTIAVPDKNVNGTLKLQDGTNVDKVWLNIHSTETNANGQWFQASVKDGQFSLYLPNGNYKVEGFWDEGAMEHIQLDYTFTVANSVSVPASLSVTVPNKNVSGTLKLQDGTNVGKAWLNIRGTDSEQQMKWLNAGVKDGRFSLYLADGAYEVEGYWDEAAQEHVQLSFKFTVTNGISNPPQLALVVSNKNVSGILKLQDGTNISKAWLNIHSTASESWQSYNASVRDGQFSLYLPDGNYEVNGYWDEAAQGYVQLSKTFAVTKGVSNPAQITIVVPNKNVSGTLKLKNGTNVGKAWLNIRSADDRQQQWYNTRVENGQFSLYLPDGTYEVEGYWDEFAQEHVQLSYKFSVTNAVSDPALLAVVVPDKNVTGTLKLQDGTNVAKAWLNIRSTGSTTQWFNASVKDGQFSLSLPDGNYEMEGYWDEAAQEQVQLTYSFTVSNSVSMPALLVVIVPNKNVTGSLIMEDGTKISKAWLSIRSAESTAMLTSASAGGSAPAPMQWYKTSVKDGQFNLYLPDGSYVVEGYWDETLQEQFQLSYPFKVTNSVSDPTPLVITVKNKNVSGTLKLKDGNAVQSARLNIHSTGTDFKYFNAPVKDGQFSLYMPDGTYVVEGYWDETAMEHVQLSYSFSVKNGVSEPSSLAIEVPIKNVTGTLKLQDGTNVSKTWLNIRSIEPTATSSTTATATSQLWYNTSVKDGQFSLYLPDGNYEVEGYWDETAQEHVQLSYAFTVTNDISNPAPLAITVKNKNVTGTLKLEDGTNVSKTWLNIHSTESTTTTTPASMQWYNTSVKDGLFSLYLPDGSYKVEGYWDEIAQEQVQLSYTFTVTNGKSNPASLAIIVKNKNVTGSLKREDGTNVSDVWLNIHSTVSETVSGTVYGYNVSVKNGQFSLYLPDGSYKVEGYWDNTAQESVQLSYTFTVTKGVSNPSPLEMTVMNKNVTGTLKKADGTVVIKASLRIRSTGTESKVYEVSVKDGMYSLYLPDGSYEVTGYWDGIAQNFVQLTYPFSVSGGKSIPDPLAIIK